MDLTSRQVRALLAPAEPLVLAVLPGQTERQRVVVALAAEGGLELQHQSWGEGVGWFGQSTVRLDREQAAQLRALLQPAPRAGGAPPSAPHGPGVPNPQGPRPRLRLYVESPAQPQ